MTIAVSFDTLYDTKTEIIKNAIVKNKGEFLEIEGDNKKLTVRKSQIIYMVEKKNE